VTDSNENEGFANAVAEVRSAVGRGMIRSYTLRGSSACRSPVQPSIAVSMSR